MAVSKLPKIVFNSYVLYVEYATNDRGSFDQPPQPRSKPIGYLMEVVIRRSRRPYIGLTMNRVWF